MIPLYPDGNRYYSFDLFCKQTFGGKTAKIPIDGGFGCPNRDGTVSSRGCLFCSDRGSGDFCGHQSITEQIQSFINASAEYNTSSKWSRAERFIAFFQSFSGTYAPIDILSNRYEEALSASDKIVGLAIATRADCIDDAKAKLLSQLCSRTFLWVELGLQTVHEPTRRAMNIGYSMEDFRIGYDILQKNNIPTVLHIIFGLPGETDEDMMATVDYAASLRPFGVKFHQLMILRGTPLEAMYNAGQITTLTQEHYTDLAAESILRLPHSTIIHRMNSDAAESDIIAPNWSRDKLQTINMIRHKLKIMSNK